MSRQLRYIIYKLSDDFKEIVIESTSEGPTENYDEFREKLVNAQTKSATVGPSFPPGDCLLAAIVSQSTQPSPAQFSPIMRKGAIRTPETTITMHRPTLTS